MIELLEHFPPIDYAAAYGSAVFSQANHNSCDSMIDYIFAVKEPILWHEENLKNHRSHYSALGTLGPTAISKIQDNFGAGIYYNALVPMPGRPDRMIKYGVISSDKLVKDLTQWNTLYISGRLHKPVKILQSTNVFDKAMKLNLQYALSAALLMLPEKISFEELLMNIASLSYVGDFRMQFGENPNKVQNIVHGSFEQFRQLYIPIIQSSKFVQSSHDLNTLWIDTTTQARTELILQLPGHLFGLSSECSVYPRNKNNKAEKHISTMTNMDRQIVLSASRDTSNRVLCKSLSRIVSTYSRTQSIKGIFTAGFMRSARYVSQKLLKTYWK